jgi:hypothetical protein
LGKPPRTWRSLEGSGYLGWAVNDSEPRPLYKPVKGSVKTLQPDFLRLEYSGSHWNEENEEWAWRAPGEEQKSHL